jgi:hypothetical protein
MHDGEREREREGGLVERTEGIKPGIDPYLICVRIYVHFLFCFKVLEGGRGGYSGCICVFSFSSALYYVLPVCRGF